MKQWYEELFANYGKNYDMEHFTKGTDGECDFIEAEMENRDGKKLLDIGCGTGRHSIELCKRGFEVTGIDLSKALLQQAKEKANKLDLSIDFTCMDARALNFTEEFDLAIMLCEGAFPLMETDEMNFEILRGAYRAIKPGGLFIFTTLNGLFPLHHSPADFCNQDTGVTQYQDTRFDLMTLRAFDIVRTIDDDGKEIELQCNERYYMPSEIDWLLKSAGFVNIQIHAARLGEFSKEHKLTTDDYEMLVICEKPEQQTIPL